VSSESQGQESSVQPDADTAAASAAIFLATEVTIQTGDQQLLLAFKGLPMPKAMTQPSAHEPVFATQMQIEHMSSAVTVIDQQGARGAVALAAGSTMVAESGPSAYQPGRLSPLAIQRQ